MRPFFSFVAIVVLFLFVMSICTLQASMPDDDDDEYQDVKDEADKYNRGK